MPDPSRSPKNNPLPAIYTPKYTIGVVSLFLPSVYPVLMKTAPPDHPFLFDSPAAYRIVVRGWLSKRLSDRLEGMVITQAVDHDGVQMSVLIGELPDQPALFGVLYTLYELHFVLISVEKISPGDLRSGLEADLMAAH